MTTYKIGDVVTVNFGKIPMIGTVVYIDAKQESYLVRFNPHQQMYYKAEDLQLYQKPQK